MKHSKYGLLVLAVLAFGACPRAEERDLTPDTAAVVPPADPGAVPEAMRSIEIEPLPGADVAGQALLVPIGVQSQISLHVHRAPPNVAITAHLMTGSCAEPGPTAADLQPLTTDASGIGSSQIAVAIPPDVLLNGNHSVQLRRRNGRDGVPVACGEIPAHPRLNPGD